MAPHQPPGSPGWNWSGWGWDYYLVRNPHGDLATPKDFKLNPKTLLSPHMPITSEQLETLKNEIGIWAEKNFSVHLPALGVLEEIGEAAHCVLKRTQGIRGFGNFTYFKEQFSDAIADTGIYLLHWAYLGNLDLRGISFEQPVTWNEDYPMDGRIGLVLADLCDGAALLLRPQGAFGPAPGKRFNHLSSSLVNLGGLYDIDAWEAVNKVWKEKVSKRDWKENPEHAAAVQEAQENIPFSGAETPS